MICNIKNSPFIKSKTIAHRLIFVLSIFIEILLTQNSSIIQAIASVTDNMAFITAEPTELNGRCEKRWIDVNIKYLRVACYAVNMHNPIFCFTWHHITLFTVARIIRWSCVFNTNDVCFRLNIDKCISSSRRSHKIVA